MDVAIARTAIIACLREIRDRLAQASALSEAALICAEKGSAAEAMQIGLDIEQPIFDATRLLDAASLLTRISTG